MWKKAPHVLKKWFFFKIVWFFFKKALLQGPNSFRFSENSRFFVFIFSLNLTSIAGAIHFFFYKKLVHIVSIKQKKNSLKKIKFWRFLTLSNKKAASLGAKNCNITTLCHVFFFSCFSYFEGLYSSHKTKWIFWKKKVSKKWKKKRPKSLHFVIFRVL